MWLNNRSVNGISFNWHVLIKSVLNNTKSEIKRVGLSNNSRRSTAALACRLSGTPFTRPRGSRPAAIPRGRSRSPSHLPRERRRTPPPPLQTAPRLTLEFSALHVCPDEEKLRTFLAGSNPPVRTLYIAKFSARSFVSSKGKFYFRLTLQKFRGVEGEELA